MRTSGVKRMRRFATAALLFLSATHLAVSAAVTVSDDSGRSLTLAEIPQRIVSLAPGATEMLFAAGAGPQVVATVEYSDEPPAAKRVPRIGDVVAIDMERLVSARPQVVVVWPGGGNVAQIEAIEKMGIPVYRQQVNRLADLPGSLRRLGALAGTSASADREARAIETRLAQLAHTYENNKHPSVLLQVWNHPIYTVGGTQLISDAVGVCGARNVFGDLRDLSPAIDQEAVVARDPDVIVAIAAAGTGSQWLSDWRRLPSLRAVRKGNLFAFEDERLVRLGPTVIEATAALCKLLATAR